MSAVRRRRRPLLVPGTDESDEDEQDRGNDDEFADPNLMDSVGVVPGPREPAGNLQEASTSLYKLKVIFGLLTLIAFLLGWVARDALITLSSSGDRIRSEWGKDYKAHQERMQAERAQWDSERQLELEKRRKEQEQAKEEEEKKKEVMIKWAQPSPDPQCLRQGTRKWTSKLRNVPLGYDLTKACYETSALIHGRQQVPDFCEMDPRGGILGIWHITFNEAACHTRLGPIVDMGCTSKGSGKKFVARMENLQTGDDWKAMCTSTPAEFNDWRFDKPHSCEDWRSMGLGYRGFWFIEDVTCS